jgi:hypothetical protein
LLNHQNEKKNIFVSFHIQQTILRKEKKKRKNQKKEIEKEIIKITINNLMMSRKRKEKQNLTKTVMAKKKNLFQ